jgi:hypothetical protein
LPIVSVASPPHACPAKLTPASAAAMKRARRARITFFDSSSIASSLLQ